MLDTLIGSFETLQKLSTSILMAPAASRKQRLPKLVPNGYKAFGDHVTPKAGAANTVCSANASVQLDFNTPRTSRTHDISHLRDRSQGIGRSIPPSLIPEDDFVFESAFMPKDPSSVYSVVDGLWHTQVFPSNVPSSRADATMLDDWITRRLVEYQRSHSCDIDLSQAVKDLVPILSVGVHEIVRQVMHHCFERGVVLDKLWKAYVDVFNRVLRSMQLSLGMAEHSKSKVEGVHSAARDDLEELKRAHPEQMHKVIMDLEAQFTSNMRDIEDQLINLSQENEHLQKEHRKCSRELDIWYPNFRLYQSSYINTKIPHYTEHPSGAHQYRHGKASGKADDDSDGESGVVAEVLVAEDFKRLLTVLTPDKRRYIGLEMADVLNMTSISKQCSTPRSTRSSFQSEAEVEMQQDEKREKVASLQLEVFEQEERISELRRRIAELEISGEASSRDGSEASSHRSSASD